MTNWLFKNLKALAALFLIAILIWNLDDVGAAIGKMRAATHSLNPLTWLNLKLSEGKEAYNAEINGAVDNIVNHTLNELNETSATTSSTSTTTSNSSPTTIPDAPALHEVAWNRCW